MLFTFGKVFNNFFLEFYIYFNLFGIFLLIGWFLRREGVLKLGTLGILICGFIFYLVGNMVYISDINYFNINISDLFFILQVFSKQFFIWSSSGLRNYLTILDMLSFNFLLILVCLILTSFVNYNFLDIFYFVESLASMLILFHLNFFESKFFNLFGKIDLDFFFIGQLFWLVGDMIYSELIFHKLYFIGDLSDLFFFIGFYFFVKSFSNFKYDLNYDIVKSYN